MLPTRNSLSPTGKQVRYDAAHCDTLQYITTHCNTLKHTATLSLPPASKSGMMQRTAIHCNTSQHTATHAHCNVMQLRCLAVAVSCSCGELQVCCRHSSLSLPAANTSGVLQCVAVCCSVLQCVAVCCSVLQCATVCCSVLQCDAV